jgi:hypothetical protein
MKPQNKSAVPPSVRTNVKSLENWFLCSVFCSSFWTEQARVAYGRRISQLAMTVLAKPNMVTNLKFLWPKCQQMQQQSKYLRIDRCKGIATYPQDLCLP